MGDYSAHAYFYAHIQQPQSTSTVFYIGTVTFINMTLGYFNPQVSININTFSGSDMGFLLWNSLSADTKLTFTKQQVQI